MSVVEDLAQVNSAIAAITGGAQEYSIGGRRVRKADLQVLLKERQRLEAKQTSETGADVAVAYFDRR